MDIRGNGLKNPFCPLKFDCLEKMATQSDSQGEAQAQRYATFCIPLASLTHPVLNDLRVDLEQELEAFQLDTAEAQSQTTSTTTTTTTTTTTAADISLGLVALQLLQSLFLRLTPDQIKTHLASLESEQTAQRAALMVEGTGLLRVSLTSSNIMPLTLRLRNLVSSSSVSSSSSSSSSSSPSSSSSSSPSSPSPASLATPANPLVVKDLSTTTTPYAICLTMDEQDLATTERELDARDQQIKEERQEQETQVLYNVTPNRMLQTTNATTTVGRSSSSSSSSSSTPHMTPRQHTPTSTPGNTRTNTTPLVLRRIRQFENAVDGCTSPMRGSQHRLIGVDRHPPSQYPRPGQWMSPHHRVVSNDKKKALQRDYVGLDMNHTPSLQAYKGTGDFLPMAKWLGR